MYSGFAGERWDLEVREKSTLGPFYVSLKDENGDAWSLSGNETVTYWVKSDPDDADGSAALQHALTLDNGRFKLEIPKASFTLAQGDYHHEVTLVDGPNEYTLRWGKIVVLDRLPD